MGKLYHKYWAVPANSSNNWLLNYNIKAIHAQVWRGPDGYRTLRIQNLQTTST
jgi:hypothetical protein